MKVILGFVILAVMTIFFVFSFSDSAYSDEVKMVGTVSKIEVAVDRMSSIAVLKDSKRGEEVIVIINDELTLDKLLDKRIVEGDEVRCRFEKNDGRNISKYFKKTAGC